MTCKTSKDQSREYLFRGYLKLRVKISYIQKLREHYYTFSVLPTQLIIYIKL